MTIELGRRVRIRLTLTMRPVHYHAVTRGLLMACDEPLLVEDLVMAGTLVDTDYQSHVFDRH